MSQRNLMVPGQAISPVRRADTDMSQRNLMVPGPEIVAAGRVDTDNFELKSDSSLVGK